MKKRKKKPSVSSVKKERIPSKRRIYKFAFDKAFKMGFYFGFKDGNQKGYSLQNSTVRDTPDREGDQ